MMVSLSEQHHLAKTMSAILIGGAGRFSQSRFIYTRRSGAARLYLNYFQTVWVICSDSRRASRTRILERMPFVITLHNYQFHNTGVDRWESSKIRIRSRSSACKDTDQVAPAHRVILCHYYCELDFRRAPTENTRRSTRRGSSGGTVGKRAK